MLKNKLRLKSRIRYVEKATTEYEMKLNDLITQFTIAMTNEEAKLLRSVKGVMPLESFDEREQFVLEGLIRKSLVSKVHNNGNTMVVANDESLNK